MLVPALLALAGLAIAGVLVAVLTAGGAGKKPALANRSAGRQSSHRTARTTSTRATTSARATTTTSGQARTSTSTAPATSTAGAAAPSAAPTTPAGAVEQFYTAAARHDYAAAWALADPNLQGQLHGYAAFQNLMSSVRSITFHRAQTLGGGTPNTATVAVQTTSVQTDRTQQCSGTARTVRTSAGSWSVDGISINCS
jgi:cytoskeletal protein RodZ